MTYVKAANAASNFRKVKALVTGVTGANDPHIVNAVNLSVTLENDSDVYMRCYLPRLGGILAACPIDSSVTYAPLTDLKAADPVADVGTSEVVASPVAQVMIHLPWMQTVGDRRDHLDSVEMLDSVTDSILNAYTVKCGGKTDRGQLKSLMRASSWLTAPEAKELGLVDRISGEDRIDPAAVLNSCGGGCGIRSLAGRPAPSYEDLLSRYREQVQAGIAPERREALNAVTSLEMPLPALTTNCAISSASTDGLPVQWVTGTSATISTQSLSPWSFPITGSAARDFAAEAQQEGEDAAEAQQEAEAELQEAKARLELEKIRFGG